MSHRITVTEFDLEWLQSEPNVTRWTALDGTIHIVNIAPFRKEAFRRTPFCVRCGKEGKSLVLVANMENNRSRSVELIDKWGTRMTIDHIHPKCRGGRNQLDNLQVLCSHCNRLKGSKSQRAFLNQDSHRGFEWRVIPTC
jgi:5-methylcytosine-specific restriction endonuclease McrA